MPRAPARAGSFQRHSQVMVVLPCLGILCILGLEILCSALISLEESFSRLGFP